MSGLPGLCTEAGGWCCSHGWGDGEGWRPFLCSALAIITQWKPSLPSLWKETEVKQCQAVPCPPNFTACFSHSPVVSLSLVCSWFTLRNKCNFDFELVHSINSGFLAAYLSWVMLNEWIIPAQQQQGKASFKDGSCSLFSSTKGSACGCPWFRVQQDGLK